VIKIHPKEVVIYSFRPHSALFFLVFFVLSGKFGLVPHIFCHFWLRVEIMAFLDFWTRTLILGQNGPGPGPKRSAS